MDRLVSDWNVVRYTLIPLCDAPEKTRAFLRGLLNDPPDPEWRSVSYAVLDAASGNVNGLCGIAIRKGAAEGEIWYVVDPIHWGCGIATQAARGLLRIGFHRLGLHRLWASCLPENPASARVLEKIGMHREGLLRQNLNIHGAWHDSYVYGIRRGAGFQAATDPKTAATGRRTARKPAQTPSPPARSA